MPTPFPGPTADALNVTVLLGGPSAERKVSLASGQAVVNAMRSRGHTVREVDPARIDIGQIDYSGTDCVFIALHGAFGEDGQVQAALEQMGVPYIGSGPQASALAMNKAAAKEQFLRHSIPTPAYACIGSGEPVRIVQARADRLGYPLVVKPIENGSSLGVSVVTEPGQLPAAIEACFTYEPTGLLEQYIAGREMTVGILNDAALPIVELKVPGRDFYDFTAKYLSDKTVYAFDVDLPETTYLEFQRLGQQAHRALGCCDFSRVDLRVDPDGQPFVLEVNTIPGLTDHSLLPKAAARAGLSFAELCEAMVRYALVKYRVAA